jgi:hypothetical protein
VRAGCSESAGDEQREEDALLVLPLRLWTGTYSPDSEGEEAVEDARDEEREGMATGEDIVRTMLELGGSRRPGGKLGR